MMVGTLDAQDTTINSSSSDNGSETSDGSDSGAKGGGQGRLSRIAGSLADGEGLLRSFRARRNVCGGAPVVITKLSSFPSNHGCPEGDGDNAVGSDVSCTCLSGLMDPEATSWEIHVASMRNETPPLGTDGIAAISSIGTFTVPRKLATLYEQHASAVRLR